MYQVSVFVSKYNPVVKDVSNSDLVKLLQKCYDEGATSGSFEIKENAGDIEVVFDREYINDSEYLVKKQEESGKSLKHCAMEQLAEELALTTVDGLIGELVFQLYSKRGVVTGFLGALDEMDMDDFRYALKRLADLPNVDSLPWAEYIRALVFKFNISVTCLHGVWTAFLGPDPEIALFRATRSRYDDAVLSLVVAYKLEDSRDKITF